MVVYGEISRGKGIHRGNISCHPVNLKVDIERVHGWKQEQEESLHVDFLLHCEWYVPGGCARALDGDEGPRARDCERAVTQSIQS